MKFPHIVVLDGKWYPAGTDVPVGEPSAEKQIEVEDVIAEETDNAVPVQKAFPYTRQELQRMKAQDVKDLAISLGFNNVDDFSANEIKRNICRMYNL